MLNKEEEQRLKGIIEKIVTCKMDLDLKYPKLNSYDIEWLAWKFKETNEELKDLHSRYNQLDIMLATALQVITDSGNMSEYLKLRNQ